MNESSLDIEIVVLQDEEESARVIRLLKEKINVFYNSSIQSF